jgi:ABC-type glutathione transport system ATPase component
VLFDGVDWLALEKGLNRRRRDLGVVFPDPAASLDGRMSVENRLGPLAIHGLHPGAARKSA